MSSWGSVSRSGKAKRDSIFWLDKKMSEERTKRPENIRPKMDIGERAKQFAPYAALGRMDTILKEVERQQDVGDPEHEMIFDDLSLDEIEQLMSENVSAEEK
ncbi:MAG: hypothetical protein IKZ95_00390 [Lachnospiraceae bacterium]|nr:hypothetical protein [Lachnospiraceae bacterium]